MVDAGESKIFMSTRDTLIRGFMAGAILALPRCVRGRGDRADRLAAGGCHAVSGGLRDALPDGFRPAHRGFHADAAALLDRRPA